ncbi:MAG TPA: O-antigen ligase [Methylophilaceae bacterium]|jgi:O-antigen ligase
MSLQTKALYYRNFHHSKRDDPNYLQTFYFFCFITVLSLIVISIKYGAAAATDRLGQIDTEGAAGDASRQVLYLSLFLIVLAVAWYQRGSSILSAVSIPYNIACIWAIVSCIWAIEPSISFRRSIGMYIVLQTVCMLVQSLGTRQTVRAVYLLLAALTLSSLISVSLSSTSFFSFAVHPPNEADSTLIGTWRGVFMHKNVAGAVMTYALLLFFHFGLNRKKAIDWVLFGCACLLLIGTKSKTSIALAGFVLVAGLIFRFFMARKGGKVIFCLILIYSLVCIFIVAIIEQEVLYDYFSHPSNLSGRIAIWTSLLNYIDRHVWLGSGYGSFWTIGYSSPIYSIATKPFIREIGHAHSGYFEILLSTGVIGLVLALVALVILPLYRLLGARPRDAKLFAFCFSVWLFGILQNFTESQFFSPDKQSWVFVVISISIVHNLYLRRRKHRLMVQQFRERLSPPRSQLVPVVYSASKVFPLPQNDLRRDNKS